MSRQVSTGCPLQEKLAVVMKFEHLAVGVGLAEGTCSSEMSR